MDGLCFCLLLVHAGLLAILSFLFSLSTFLYRLVLFVRHNSCICMMFLLQFQTVQLNMTGDIREATVTHIADIEISAGKLAYLYYLYINMLKVEKGDILPPIVSYSFLSPSLICCIQCSCRKDICETMNSID